MEQRSMFRIIEKLAIAGERAGFSVAEMIQLLNNGLSVETLLQLIAQRLEADGLAQQGRPASSCRWII